MAGETERREIVTRRLAPDEELELIVDIRVVDGESGRRLAIEQARVLWEVTEWLARTRSEPGQERAA